MSNLNLAIVIATFQRKDGRSPDYLKRALDSVFSQTYQNFKIFLIGDKYENEIEILSILDGYDKSKIFFKNLPFAKERDIYTGLALWHYGGITAMNEGVEESLRNGYEYVCHLDHDDWWYEEHLETIVDCINKTDSAWVCTKSTFGNPKIFLPNYNSTELYIPFSPRWATLIHSSVCMNFKKIPLRYRDVLADTKQMGLPGDADLWERVNIYSKNNNLKCTFINKLTCRHDEEGYSRNN